MSVSVAEKFGMPTAAHPYVDLFLTAQDRALIAQVKTEVFGPHDIAGAIGTDVDGYIASAYRRGVLSIADETRNLYRLSGFYGFLDVFAITERAAYQTLPREVRDALDGWYFDAYCGGLSPSAARPTEDKVLTLEETLDFIDRQEQPVYLNVCDCRSLRGDCGLPTRTCITYRNGINTFAHRGLSEKIDRERAKEVVRQADRAGLMHTVNPNGICNCCDDCCYLFRAQRRRNSLGVWPESVHRVSFDPARCIACGRCTRRCHFGVFEKKDGAVTVRDETCVGCGLCAAVCPGGALTMKERRSET